MFDIPRLHPLCCVWSQSHHGTGASSPVLPHGAAARRKVRPADPWPWLAPWPRGPPPSVQLGNALEMEEADQKMVENGGRWWNSRLVALLHPLFLG